MCRYRSPASGWLFTSATRVATVRPWPSSELPTRNGGPTMCASMFSFSAGTPEPGATPASATLRPATMISSNHSCPAVTPVASRVRIWVSATGRAGGGGELDRRPEQPLRLVPGGHVGESVAVGVRVERVLDGHVPRRVHQGTRRAQRHRRARSLGAAPGDAVGGRRVCRSR